MVAYHSLNYLDYGTLPHEYLTFVPTSFILISGFIITQFYSRKYGLDSRDLISRLATRSVKLLLIFISLNLGVRILLLGTNGGINSSLWAMLEEWIAIFIRGGGRATAFEILVPIAYLLIISIPVLKFQRKVLHVVKAGPITLISFGLLLNIVSSSIYNVYMISSGIIGLGIGLVSLDRIAGLTRSWIKLILFYVLYWVAALVFGDTYFKQISCTVVSLLIIYAAGNNLDIQRPLARQVVLLGRYSLFSYIAQIFYLQVLFRCIAHGGIGEPNAFTVIFSISILTWVTVMGVEHFRLRYRCIDQVYKAVFA